MSIPHHRPHPSSGHIPVQYESTSPLTPKVSLKEAVENSRRALQGPPMNNDSISFGGNADRANKKRR